MDLDWWQLIGIAVLIVFTIWLVIGWWRRYQHWERFEKPRRRR